VPRFFLKPLGRGIGSQFAKRDDNKTLSGDPPHPDAIFLVIASSLTYEGRPIITPKRIFIIRPRDPHPTCRKCSESNCPGEVEGNFLLSLSPIYQLAANEILGNFDNRISMNVVLFPWDELKLDVVKFLGHNARP
jgi:hypothetical protein